MKFIISKEGLVDGLQEVIGPTTTKQNFPILNSVLLTTEQNKIKFTATDLDITIISLQAAQIQEKGSIAVPMKRLFSIARELPPGEIVIEKNKNNLSIRCEKVEFKINTLNPDEFPQTQEEKGVSLIKMDPQSLSEMIKLTSFCVGYEDANYVLGGILFEIEKNTIKLVSTDGKRLSFVTKKLSPNQPELTTKITFILPIKATTELYKLVKEQDQEIYFSVTENKTSFFVEDMQLMARPVEGEFPDYSQYIPGESKNKLTIKRKEFLFALRRASLLATADHQGVKFELRKNNVGIHKSTPQLGEVRESLAVKYEGTSLDIGFNPNYLTDVLKNLEDEDVVLEFFGNDKPAVLKKEGYVYLLLPMKT